MEYDEFVVRTDWKLGEIYGKWVAKRILKVALKKVDLNPSNLRMLEVGVGRGWLIQAARKRGITNLVGIEPNTTLAGICRSKIANFDVLEVSLPVLPNELTGSMDLVIASQVIEHASSPSEAREWINAILNTTKEGGVIAIICPDLLEFKEYFWDIDWSHGFPTTVNRLVQIFSDLNCEILMARKFRLGSVGIFANFVAIAVNAIVPTRLLDLLGETLMNRSLGRGFKAGFIWSNAFIIARKPIIL